MHWIINYRRRLLSVGLIVLAIVFVDGMARLGWVVPGAPTLLLPILAIATLVGGWVPGVVGAVIATIYHLYFHEAHLPTIIDWSDPVFRQNVLAEIVASIMIVAVCGVLRRQLANDKRLRESERRYQQLYESMTEGFALCELLRNGAGAPHDFRFLKINPAFTRITQWGADQVVGHTMRELNPRVEQFWIDRFAETTSGRTVHVEGLAEGLSTWYEAWAFPAGDDRFALFFLDITERKQAARALQESERRFRHLANAGPVLVWTTDTDANVTYLNDRWREYTGAGDEQSMGTGWQARIHPDDLPRVQSSWREALAHSRMFEIEARVRRHDGEYRWFLSRAMPVLNNEGQVEQWIGISMDVHDRKTAQQQLEELNETLEQRVVDRTAELQQRSEQLRLLASELTDAEQRERRRLAQVLHDDLQQLLVGAKMHLSTLSEHRPKGNGCAPANQVAAMIDQAIESARSLSTELAPPVLYEMGLRAALHWLARRSERKYGLQVGVEADESIEEPGEQLAVLLFQAVRELLLNIVKHAEVDKADVHMTRDGDRLSIVVADCGQGFNPEQVERPADELGFGLFNLTERLRLFGGDMHIDSAPGEGTRVCLSMPYDRNIPAAHDPEHDVTTPSHGTTAAPCKAGPIRVMLVDDHSVVRRGLAMMIEGEPDLELIGEAACGAEALTQARALKPDLVVMDITMPGMDGIEATRQLTREMPHVRVIGLSVHEAEDAADTMRNAGAVGYLCKSAPAEDLLAAIRDASGAPAIGSAAHQ